jgi:hypothetical protein
MGGLFIQSFMKSCHLMSIVFMSVIELGYGQLDGLARDACNSCVTSKPYKMSAIIFKKRTSLDFS